MTILEIEADWMNFMSIVPPDHWIDWENTMYKKNFRGFRVVITFGDRTKTYTIKRGWKVVKEGTKSYPDLLRAMLMAFYWIESRKDGCEQAVLDAWTRREGDECKARYEADEAWKADRRSAQQGGANGLQENQ